MADRYEELGREIGALVDQKNRAYGSSFSKCGDFLALLYPHGMRPEQYADALLLVRIFDKQMRAATDADSFGESPFADIAGYGLLGAEQHRERVNTGCGSAKQGAGERSRATPGDSAERAASASTTPNANEGSEKSSTMPSRPPSEPTSESTAVPAPTVTADAWQSAVALGKIANDASCCANSIHPFAHSMLLPSKYQLCIQEASKLIILYFCSKRCSDLFLEINR